MSWVIYEMSHCVSQMLKKKEKNLPTKYYINNIILDSAWSELQSLAQG